MVWRVEFNAEWGCIHSVYSGAFTKQDADEATAAALSLAPGDGPHLFLTDLLDADSKLSTVDIYSTPREWEIAGVSRAHRLALVVPEGGRMWNDAQFYETTCCNRGWQVKVFSCKQRAIDWLTGRGSSSKPEAGDG